MSVAPSRRRTVLAPGKLVLLGEYAVLDGAGAIVAAVDRGVGCEVRPSETLHIETPGDDRFVRAALQGTTGHYRFFDWNPVALSSKAGFGGSAAATVAAVAACGAPLQHAVEVHHRVQGGGSGVDVFASIHGDVRRFPDGAPTPCPPMVAVWSGQSALTGPRVVRYLGWAGREAFVAQSRAWVRHFVDEPVATLADAAEGLLAMAQQAGLDYDTPALAEIRRLAREAGGAAKASGAGGGDIAVGLFPDPERQAWFEHQCQRAGLVPIPVRVSPGVHEAAPESA